MKIHGILPAMVTPATPDGLGIDFDAVTTLTHSMIERGVHGLFAASSTGEAPLLTREQRHRLVATVVETAAGRVPVIAGVGAPATNQSIEFARDAVAAGADAVAALPLHFVRINDGELYNYFAAIADAVPVPTLLYNYPALSSGQNISDAVAAKLAQSHNVIGIKDSGGNLTNTLSYLTACGSDFITLTGDESQLFPLLACGGHGTICAAANVFPEMLSTLYDFTLQKDFAGAREVHDRVLGIRSLLAIGTFPAGVKSAVAWSGIDIGPPMKPVNPLTNDQKAQQGSALTRFAAISNGL